MVGGLNKLPIAISGMLFFHDPVTFSSVSSILIAFTAGLVYSYAKTLKSDSGLPVYSPVNMKKVDDIEDEQ